MAQARSTIGKGALYVYIETLCSTAFSYILLLILSNLTSAATIGILSLVLSLSNIFTNIITLGVPTGVQRFLGKGFSGQDMGEVELYVKSSVMIISVSIILSGLFLWLLKDIVFPRFELSFVLLTIILMASSSMGLLLRSVILASLKTRILPVAAFASFAAKAILAIGLFMIGSGALGITFAYAIGQVLPCALLGLVAYSHVKKSVKSALRVSQSLKEIMHAGIVSWIPRLVTTVGTQLGTVVVFGTAGANQAGGYFIALSIFSAVSTLMAVLLSVAYPALSGMTDGRKRLTWRMTKISLMISLPLSAGLFFYSTDILRLVGPDYGQASEPLRILLLSMLPSVIFSGVNTLVYSYGNYKQVLFLGLASSLPRVILYFLLVPIYGTDGAAISFTIGSITGFAISVVISRKIGFKIFWWMLLVTFSVPMAVAFLLNIAGVGYVLGIIGTLLISIVSFTIPKILTKSDIVDSVHVLPPKMANPIMNILNVIERRFSSGQKNQSAS